MKSVGFIIALGVTLGAVLTGRFLYSNRAKKNTNEKKRWNNDKKDEEEEVHSSISRSYVYVADF
jgi:hypothetical protein